MSSLTVRNEYCKAVADEGVVQSMLNLLTEPELPRPVVIQTLFLLKTLAGNDDVKKQMTDLKALAIIADRVSNELVTPN